MFKLPTVLYGMEFIRNILPALGMMRSSKLKFVGDIGIEPMTSCMLDRCAQPTTLIAQIGAEDRIRTCNLRFTKPLLYR